MTDRLDHSHRRNLRHWIAGGFVAIAVIVCASFNPLGPGIDPGEYGDRGNVVVAKAEIPLGERIVQSQGRFKQKFPWENTLAPGSRLLPSRESASKRLRTMSGCWIESPQS
jgi:hypothetical protein